MGLLTLLLIVVWILNSLLLSPQIRQGLPAGVQLFLDLLTILLAVPAIYYIWRFFALVRRRLLWKIRRRLILAHILIAAIPVALVVVILYISGLLLYYQLSYYLIVNQIGIHTGRIHAFNLSLSAGLQEGVSSGSESPFALKPELDRDSRFLLGEYPAAAVVLRVTDPATGQSRVFGSGNVASEPQDYVLPSWTGDSDFNGLIYEDIQPEIYRRARQEGAGHRGRLYLRSLIFGEFQREIPYSIEISLPFDGYMLDRLKAALGQDLLVADHVPDTGLNVMMQDTRILKKNILYSTADLDAGDEPVGGPVWSILLYPVSWGSGAEMGPANAEVLFIELSSSKLIQNVFRSENVVSRTILGVLEIVVGFFLLVELISLVAGIVLTKSITNAVYNLDRGTEFIRRGDFSHRIVVKSDDQLGALAKSFNQMTEYIQRLVKERVEKERLERELEIAQEVQAQLFPRGAPKMERIELTGLCLPARVVSGDYYDFLQFNPHRIGLALGDICGKGISAALLMANLQATLRSNVVRIPQNSDGPAGEPGVERVADVVKILNHQICNYTSANKFATFFYAVYDERLSSFTYCNAGHNPPLFFSGNDFRRLETGGTVVGIFPDAEFSQERVAVGVGDILLAYTDGIVESVNEYGQEFGEQRLVDIVWKNRALSAGELQKIIVERVLDWAFEEERDDDMTLIIGKIH